MRRLVQAIRTAGGQFARLWDDTLLKNYEKFQNRDLRPVWLDKSWQALWNWNDHNQGHGIDLHSDYSDTYSSLDPITSLSFGHGGALTLGTKKGQPGSFSWSLSMVDALEGRSHVQWRTGRSLVLHMKLRCMNVRANCRIRWHTKHMGLCPMRSSHLTSGLFHEPSHPNVSVPASVQFAGFKGSGTKPVVAGEVQPSDLWAVDEPLHPNVSAPASVQFAGFKGSGTKPVVAGQVQPSDLWAVDEPLHPNVSAPASVQFAGFKRLGRTGAEQVQADHGCQGFHEKAVQTDGLPDIVRTLLVCLDQCAQQSELFRLVLHGIPMVEATAAHAETLLKLESTVQH